MLVDFFERRKKMECAIKEGRRVIIYFCEDVDSYQFRYRCNNLVKIFNGHRDMCVVWFLKSEIKMMEAYICKVSLIVLTRQTCKDDIIMGLLGGARRVGVRVIFDVDDLVFDYRDLLVLKRNVSEKNILYWAGYMLGIRRIAKKVDGFLTTNDFLGRKLKRSFCKPYKVIPNSLNREQVEVSNEYLKNKNNNRNSFVVGYFSGSPTHNNDFKMVEPELIDFMKFHDDVCVKVVGYMRFSHAMKKWLDSGRVELIGRMDYLKLQREMAAVDVNIAPLIINDFTNCKSELKFFEAAAVETTTIASPTYSFKRAIIEGKNGYLARPGEWYRKLEYLYNNPEENQEVAKEARKYALKKYYGDEILKQAEAAYKFFIARNKKGQK